jgi:hypothetical protein
VARSARLEFRLDGQAIGRMHHEQARDEGADFSDGEGSALVLKRRQVKIGRRSKRGHSRATALRS